MLIVIKDINSLQNIGNIPDYPLDGHYVLANDIDASITAKWNNGNGFNPIGSENYPFTGTFDGNDFTISNLFIKKVLESNIGLLGYTTKTAKVYNTKLKNIQIHASSVIGGLIGKNQGHVVNCHTDGTITINIKEGGGLIGNNTYGIVENCSSKVQVLGSIFKYGGLIGYNKYGTITNCHADKDISTTYTYITKNTPECIGGLIGENIYSTVEECSVKYITITGVRNKHVGGLIGYNRCSDIARCYTDCTIAGSKYIGGLIGYNVNSKVVDCTASCTIINNEQDTGGLIGYNYNSDIDSCLATAKIQHSKDGKRVGGLIGQNKNSSIIKSLTNGGVSGFECVGGFIGYNYESSLSDNGSSVDVSGQACIGGFIGQNIRKFIKNCYAIGSVTAHSHVDSNDCGGFIGSNSGSIQGSWCKGDVIGRCSAGGFIGSHYEGTIVTCFSSGSCRGHDDIGGFIGICSDGVLVNCSCDGVALGHVNYNPFIGRVTDTNFIQLRYCKALNNIIK